MWATAEGHRDDHARADRRGRRRAARSRRLASRRCCLRPATATSKPPRILIAAGAGVNERGSDGTHALPLAIVSGQGRVRAVPAGAGGGSATARCTAWARCTPQSGSVDDWLRDWLRARARLRRRASHGRPRRRSAGAAGQSAARAGADPNARITTSDGDGTRRLGQARRVRFRSTGTGNLKGATPLWIASYARARRRDDRQARRRAGRLILVNRFDCCWKRAPNPIWRPRIGTTPLMVAAGLGRSSYNPRRTKRSSLSLGGSSREDAGRGGCRCQRGERGQIHRSARSRLPGVERVDPVPGGAGRPTSMRQDFLRTDPYRIAKVVQQMFSGPALARNGGVPQEARRRRQFGPASAGTGTRGRAAQGR